MILMPNGAPAHPSMLAPASQRGKANGYDLVSTTLSPANSSYEMQMQVLARELEVQPRYADSLALQTRWKTGIDPYYFDQKRDQKSKLMTMKRQAWERTDWFLRYYSTHFKEIVDLENNNWDFYAGYQWDKDELRNITKAGLIPHTADYTSRWARTLIGEERGADTIFNFVNDDPQYQPVADIYNDVVPKICYMNDWADKSSGDFANLAIGGRCFSSVRPHPYDPFRRIQMRSERTAEFMYDFENAENGALDGCSEMTRVYWRDLEELIAIYPWWEDYLRGYNFAETTGLETMLAFTVAQPKVAPTAGKRAYQAPATFINRPYSQNRRVAWVTEHYVKGGIKKWVVRDLNFNIDHDFDAVDQAAYVYRNLRDAYLAKNVAMTGDPGIDLIVTPEQVTREVVDQEMWVGDVLIDLQTSNTPRFPYLGQHNEFHRGEWRGFFQSDKSNQQLRNRMLIYWDMLLGGVKGKTFYHKDLFPKGSTSAEIEQWARDPNKILIGDWNKTDDPGHMHLRIDPTNHGALPDTIMSYIDKASAFGNGGLNSIGDAEFAGQSDKLRRGLAESSQTGVVPLMKDWAWHERRVGQHTAFVASFLDPVVLLGMVNSSNRANVMETLQQGNHTIELDSLSCQVEEVLAGPRKRAQQKATLLETIQNDPEGASDIRPELFKLDELPMDMVQRIEQRRQQREQAVSDQQAHEQQMAEYELQMKWGINERKVQVEEGQLAVAKQPPIGVTLAMKGNAPGPDAMAEIYQQHNIDADPAHIIASEAKQDLKDQARDNLKQEQFNKRDIPYQKALSAFAPKPAAGKSGTGAKSKGNTRSPKDSSARSRKGAEKAKTQV